MNKDNIIGGSLVALTILYGVFHVGRWYETREAGRLIGQTVYTAYTIPQSNPQYGGELAIGNCMTNRAFERLLEYAGLDY